ncbi:ABC transporter permease [Rarobacter faecitabidus]|uniref:Transport permease protein n=1 Tax=Rarobacter faecitabidus TaxID=13243 RepID=A0A542ZU79_RARFA|nr:ABC transporter permease [Rarobacter faecitabidus]TQL63913.1 teichoic acid transport system permease protein [Rarobacter faecitabidus]
MNRVESRRGRSSAAPPGQDPDGGEGAIPDEKLTSGDLAARYGLKPVGVRAGLVEYVRDLIRWAPFTVALGLAQASSRNRASYLGQIWNFLNPILNSAVYILVFGLLLDTSRGVTNVVGFIVVGVFMYRSFSDVVTGAGKSIRRSKSLIKSLPFPRASMPLSSTVSEAAVLGPEVVVMLVIIWLSGFIPRMATVTWSWHIILVIPGLMLLYAFSLGCGLFVARLVAFVPDIAKLLPFVLRLVMYGSGAIFPVSHYFTDGTIQAILTYQPVAVMLTIIRQVTLSEPSIPFNWTMWLWALGWAIVALAVGLVFFWRAEARYGRE